MTGHGLDRFLAEPGNVLDAPEDAKAALDSVMKRGWGDGFPVVPPTPKRVERMLRYWDRPWDKVIGVFPPKDGNITAARVAANAVMAGCRPDYFPMVMLIIEAICEAPFNLKAVQSTTHPCSPLVIFNGPVGRELGVNSGYNAFGPASGPTPPSGGLCGLRCRTSAAQCRGWVTWRRWGSLASTASSWPRTKMPTRGSRCMSSAASTKM